MSFINEIKTLMQIDGELPLNYRAVVFGDKGAYFENVKAIKSYNEKCVTLTLKHGEITVNGNGLYIKKYCGGDIIILGKIAGWEVSGA